MGAIVFKGDMPLDEFLAQNKPSSTDTPRGYKWIQVRNPNSANWQSQANPEKEVLKEWRKRLTKSASSGRITHDFVTRLAEKYNYKTGKWLVYLPCAEIDAAWESVAKAVVSGSLGSCAKVSTYDPKKATHVICVYTEDFTNEAEEGS